MREQGGGRIVNISAGTPFRGVPFLLHYVTSKGAIVAGFVTGQTIVIDGGQTFH